MVVHTETLKKYMKLSVMYKKYYPLAFVERQGAKGEKQHKSASYCLSHRDSH